MMVEPLRAYCTADLRVTPLLCTLVLGQCPRESYIQFRNHINYFLAPNLLHIPILRDLPCPGLLIRCLEQI